MTNGHYVIPKLVEDASLKRARTTITEGGEEKEAIQVTQVGGSGGLDSQGVADAMGLFPSSGVIESNSIIDKLSTIENKTNLTQIYTGQTKDVLGTISDIKIDSSQDGTVSSRIRQLSSDTAHIFSDVGQLLAATGSRSDSAWSGTGSGSLVAVEKRNALATGTKSDAAWSGSGDGTVIALLKGIYNKL